MTKLFSRRCWFTQSTSQPIPNDPYEQSASVWYLVVCLWSDTDGRPVESLLGTLYCMEWIRCLMEHWWTDTALCDNSLLPRTTAKILDSVHSPVARCSWSTLPNERICAHVSKRHILYLSYYFVLWGSIYFLDWFHCRVSALASVTPAAAAAAVTAIRVTCMCAWPRWAE